MQASSGAIHITLRNSNPGVRINVYARAGDVLAQGLPVSIGQLAERHLSVILKWAAAGMRRGNCKGSSRPRR